MRSDDSRYSPCGLVKEEDQRFFALVFFTSDEDEASYFFLNPAGQAAVVTFLVILPFTQVMVFFAGVLTTAAAVGL
jgi:hypothetical protein